MTDTEFVLVCEGCGHFEQHPDLDVPILVDVKENRCQHLGNAELLREIHDHKTNHRPYIRTEVREDGEQFEHVPAWADGGVRSA